MNATSRRGLLQAGLGAAALGALPLGLRAQAVSAAPSFAPQLSGWRRFEVTTSVTVANAKGAAQLWLPAPDVDSDFQRSGDNKWTGNAASVRLVNDPRQSVRLLHATFADGEPAPTLALTSTVETRNRVADWSKPARAHDDRKVLARYLEPTALHPVDGLVRTTALAATAGAGSDVEKARAIYKWVVSNCYRDPTVGGCGDGKIKVMLESGKLGGKCADLSSLFVAMNRCVGVPAREIYGLRLAPSAFGYHQLGADSANLTGAQHCRAEVWLSNYGWVAMDPADVLKVMRQEKPDWIKDLNDPLIAPVNQHLFGSWEGNWVGWNSANDIRLPGSGDSAALPFLMYPQGQDASGRFNELAPKSFSYTISAREITA